MGCPPLHDLWRKSCAPQANGEVILARQSSARTPDATSGGPRRREKTANAPKAAAKARQPITQHPLFPAIIALWFGALFGLGSLAIRVSLLESLVLKTRLDLVLRAASPPLGMTARILIALGLAAMGAAIGAMLGRMIGRPKRIVTERNRKVTDSSVSRRDAKIVEMDEDDDDDFGEVGFAAPRRRGLTVDEDVEDKYHREFAPLPGGAPQILDVTEFDFTGDAPTTATATGYTPEPEASAALDLSGYLNAAEPEVEAVRQVFHAAPAAPDAPLASPVAVEPAEPTPPAATPGNAPFARITADPAAEPATMEQSPAALSPARFAAPAKAIAPGDPALQNAAATVAAPGVPVAAACDTPKAGETHGDLVRRLAESMRLRREAAAALAAAAHAPIASDAFAPVVETSAAAAGDAALNSTPLGIFAKPGATPAFAPSETQTAPLPPFGQNAAAQPAEAGDVTRVDDNARTSPEIIVPHVTLPAAMRPLNFEEDGDDDEEALSAALPLRHIPFNTAETEATTKPGAARFTTGPEGEIAQSDNETLAEDTSASDDNALEDGYSSLLDLSRPTALRQSYVRIDEPEPEGEAIEPAVQFPGTTGFGQRPIPMGPSMAPSMAPSMTSTVSAEASASAADASIDNPADPFAPPAPAAVTPGNLRRFDAPTGGYHGGTPTSVNSNALDAEETERALRTALATLQRMSARG